jgi:hypothetical protein
MSSTIRDRQLFLGAPAGVHLAAWGSFALVTAAVAVLFYAFRDAPVWDTFMSSGEFRKPAYSEAIYPNSIFRTRANTWSNLAYVLPGLYAIALGFWDWRRKPEPTAPYVVRQPALGMLYGVACIYLGVGSGIFHASLTRWGQQLDVAAMYSPLVVLVAIHWARWLPRVRLGRRALPAWPVFALVAVVTSALLYVYKWELSSKRVMVTLILLIWAGCVLDAVTGRFSLRWRWLVVAFFSLLTAYAFRQADVAGRFTGPDAWMQGHAIWHLLTGVTLGAMVLFYRTEGRAKADAA